MRALATLYGLAVGAKNAGYDRGWLRSRALGWPVVSVGNLSVGGAGKTPLVMELARLLQARGLRVDVLSRGYGRRGSGVERVLPGGDARRFGDEPLLIADGTGAPVYVGASRWAAGVLAEREAGNERGVHLLDDGFQHRKLARAVDIVVVHPSDAGARLLPVGRLREPLSSLGRADFLILREGDEASEASLRRYGKPVWRVRRSLAPPPVQGDAVAFCGIARPEEFFAGLRAAGVRLRETRAFRDHYRFVPADLRELAERSRGAGALLTTEKDFVRLGEEARRQLSRFTPLLAVPLRAELLEADRCVSALLRLIGERCPGYLPGAMQK